MALRFPPVRRNGAQPPALELADSITGTPVRVFLYDADGTDRPIGIDDVRLHELDERRLLWIDVGELDQLEAVATSLGIAPDTVARIEHPPTRAHALFHPDYFHVTVVVAHRTALGYDAATLDCVVAQNWVLTVHDRPVEFLERFDQRITGDSKLGRLDGPGLAATFLHEHLAGYAREIEPFELELDRLDLEVMTGRVDDEAVFRRLVDLRRRLSHLRRLFAPHREIHGVLARPDFELLSDPDLPDGFASLSERSERVLQSLETTRDMIVSSFEIYTTWTAHGTNKVMKLLTVASVTLLPPTLLASVMGMNSLPAPLGTATAFLATLSFMLVLVAAVLTVARRRSWI
jgi:magnesium transporter